MTAAFEKKSLVSKEDLSRMFLQWHKVVVAAQTPEVAAEARESKMHRTVPVINNDRGFFPFTLFPSLGAHEDNLAIVM